MIERVYASAAMRKDNRFLAMHHIKKSTHQWRFPGGKVEPGETSDQAVTRELQEEIGVVPLGLLYLGQHSTLVDGGLWTGHFYLVEAWGGEPRSLEPEKIGAIEFLSVDELVNRGSHPEDVVAALVQARGI